MEIGIVPFLPKQTGILADAIPKLEPAHLHPSWRPLAHSDVVIEGSSYRTCESRFDAIPIGPDPAFLEWSAQADPKDVRLGPREFTQDELVVGTLDRAPRWRPRANNLEVRMHRLKCFGGTFGFSIAPAHDVDLIALLLGALIHFDHEVGATHATAHWSAQDLARPNQRNSIGHRKISIIQGAAISGVPAGLDHVINVREHCIAAIAAKDRRFRIIESLLKVRATNADPENIRAVLITNTR